MALIALWNKASDSWIIQKKRSTGQAIFVVHTMSSTSKHYQLPHALWSINVIMSPYFFSWAFTLLLFFKGYTYNIIHSLIQLLSGSCCQLKSNYFSASKNTKTLVDSIIKWMLTQITTWNQHICIKVQFINHHHSN